MITQQSPRRTGGQLASGTAASLRAAADYSEVIPTRPGFYVYRLWAADGTCLYVGCVGERRPRRVTQRLNEHRRDKPWWPQVARIDVASLGSSAEVIAEEPVQIAQLEPVHNKMLLGRCSHGHDMTAPDATNAEGKCARCRHDRHCVPPTAGQRARQAERARRFRATLEGSAYHSAYIRKPEVRIRRAAAQRRRSRGPGAGQMELGT